MLRGSSGSECRGFRFLGHGQSKTLPAYRAGLTDRVISAEQDKPVSLLARGKVHRKMEPMAMRVAEMGASECCPVIGQIEVASPLGDNNYLAGNGVDFPLVLKLETVHELCTNGLFSAYWG